MCQKIREHLKLQESLAQQYELAKVDECLCCLRLDRYVQPLRLNNTCSLLVYSGRLFVFICKFLAVSTPQDRIIEALEAEVIRLKTELAVVTGQRDEIKNKFRLHSSQVEEEIDHMYCSHLENDKPINNPKASLSSLETYTG